MLALLVRAWKVIDKTRAGQERRIIVTAKSPFGCSANNTFQYSRSGRM